MVHLTDLFSFLPFLYWLNTICLFILVLVTLKTFTCLYILYILVTFDWLESFESLYVGCKRSKLHFIMCKWLEAYWNLDILTFKHLISLRILLLQLLLVTSNVRVWLILTLGLMVRLVLDPNIWIVLFIFAVVLLLTNLFERMLKVCLFPALCLIVECAWHLNILVSKLLELLLIVLAVFLLLIVLVILIA